MPAVAHIRDPGHGEETNPTPDIAAAHLAALRRSSSPPSADAGARSPPDSAPLERKIMNNIRQYQLPLQRYMAFMDLQEGNERLFFKLLIDNVEELLPIVYTPTVDFLY